MTNSITNQTDDAKTFKNWRAQMGFKNQQQAADALDYSLIMVKYWESGRNPVPYAVKLAMTALYHRLTAWSLPSE